MSSASLSGVSSPPASSPNQSRSAGVAQSGSKAPLPPVPSRVAAPVRRTSGVLLQSPGVPQQGGSGGGGNNVQVICRFRPTREQESVKWFELLDDQSVQVKMGAGKGPLDFKFDRIFDPATEQVSVYESVDHVIEGIMQGFNGTILTYGQTSSGKTHTMLGKIGETGGEGVVPRSMDSLFRQVAKAGSNVEFTFKVSYVEIYCEKINDLLSPHNENLKIREDPSEGIVIAGVTEVYVSSRDEVMKLLELGRTLRATSSTLMNAESSRSHALLFVTVSQKDTTTLHVRRGKLVLVDLAGSEKVSKTGAAGMRLEEAKKINTSLTTLGMVIKALADGQAFAPMRDSKLTRVLEESLGGNSRTTLIICCAPELVHSQETVSTLRFGDRAKRIKNRAVVNEEMSVVELKQLLEKANQRIAHLEALLKAAREGKEITDADLLVPPPVPLQPLPPSPLQSPGDSDDVTSPMSPFSDDSPRAQGQALAAVGRSSDSDSDMTAALSEQMQRLASMLALKDAENAELKAANRHLNARLAEEQSAVARYEDEASTLEARVKEAEAQVHQLLSIKTDPVPAAVMEKAYGVSSPRLVPDGASALAGGDSPRDDGMVPPCSPLSASVYDKKMQSVERILYQLQDELFEQREASQTVIRSKQQMIAELLQKNAELSVQAKAHKQEVDSLQSQIEDLKRVVHSLTRPGAESGDSGGFGLYSLLGLGSSSSNKVVKTITGGGDEEESG